MKVGTGELLIVRNVFPEHILGGLQDFAHEQGERKQSFDLSRQCPSRILSAADYIKEITGAVMNTAILKRYRLDDEVPSGAYSPHPDPDQFAAETIELCSLDGEATLFVETHAGEEGIECRENTLIVMDPVVKHRVTPPQNSDGVRHLLFFGYDHTKPATIE